MFAMTRPASLRPARFTARLTGLLAAWLLQSCVTVHAPLLADSQYPADWGDILPLGPECKAVAGVYADAGSLADAAGQPRPVSLLGALGLDGRASAVSLSIQTRQTDARGDASVTLQASPDGDASAGHQLSECFCVRQALFCKVASETRWGAPGVGIGGSQGNLYFGVNRTHDLVAKLQTYDAGILLGLPLFSQQEHWLRFAATAP